MTEHPHHVADALHIYGQEDPHDPVFIIGPRERLLLLRQALDKALAGEPQSASFFTADGEGYRLVVVPVEDMRDSVLPYSETAAEGMTREGRAPHELLGSEAYRALLTGEPTVADEENP